MSTAEQKEKILSSINARGWCAMGVFCEGAKALEKEGVIKMGNRFSVGGNRTFVWLKA